MAAPGGTKLPQNGALNHKFTTQQGIQFPKQKKKKKVNPITAPPPPQPTQPPTGTKKKKKKKSKPAEVQQAPPSTKKKVSFSPGVVSTVNFTYSKQEYDRTPIMGIFNHFCNCCQTPIEGARFHCQLCPDFDLCQGCFVDKGARHVHGQQAFTCPELDELDELEDEGDEGEDIDFFKQFFTVGAEGEEPMFGAFGEEEEGDEPMFAGFGEEEGDEPVFGGFGEEEGDEADLPPACALADENGPLERITPEEAARLTVETKAEPASLEDLFPKLPASPSQPPKPTKPAQASQPSKPKQPKQPSQPSKPSQSSQSSQPSQPKPSQSKPSQPQPAQPASESSTKPKKHKKKKNKESPAQPAQPSQKQTKQTPNIAPKGQNDSKPVNVAKKSSPSKPSPAKPKAAQPAATGQTTDGGSKKRPRSEESNSSKQKIQRLSSQ